MLMDEVDLRVPSKRVAMVSRKVFCGARSPFLAGILLDDLGSGIRNPRVNPVLIRPCACLTLTILHLLLHTMYT